MSKQKAVGRPVEGRKCRVEATCHLRVVEREDDGMMKARDRVLKARWVGLEELTPAPFHADLFPLPRDLSALRRSFERHGYRPEYPLVVRANAAAGGVLEIVCGVGRYAVARERGMHRVPVVARPFGSDERVLAYAIEDNLFNAPAPSLRSLAQMIVLARALKECGVECAPRHIWEAAGVSPSTYWRAEGSLARSIGQILTEHPELDGLAFPRQVAEIIRKDLDPQLTRLLSGDVEVNTFHRAQGLSAGPGQRVDGGVGKPSKVKVRERTPVAPAAPQSPASAARQEPKAPGRKKSRAVGDDFPLFDKLTS